MKTFLVQAHRDTQGNLVPKAFEPLWNPESREEVLACQVADWFQPERANGFYGNKTRFCLNLDRDGYRVMAITTKWCERRIDEDIPEEIRHAIRYCRQVAHDRHHPNVITRLLTLTWLAEDVLSDARKELSIIAMALSRNDPEWIHPYAESLPSRIIDFLGPHTLPRLAFEWSDPTAHHKAQYLRVLRSLPGAFNVR